MYANDKGLRSLSLPVERAGKDEVIIDAELVQAICKIPLIDQTTCFVDDDECEDHPSHNPLATPMIKDEDIPYMTARR